MATENPILSLYMNELCAEGGGQRNTYVADIPVDGIEELMRLIIQVVVTHSIIFSDATFNRQLNKMKTGTKKRKKRKNYDRTIIHLRQNWKCVFSRLAGADEAHPSDADTCQQRRDIVSRCSTKIQVHKTLREVIYITISERIGKLKGIVLCNTWLWTPWMAEVKENVADEVVSRA